MWTNSYTLEQTGEFLRDVRRAKGKRQDVFARELGVSHTTLSNLEQGKNTSSRAPRSRSSLESVEYIPRATL